MSLLLLAGCGQDGATPTISLVAPDPATAKPASGYAQTPVGIAPPNATSSGPVLPADVDAATITAKGNPKESWEAVFAYGAKIGWGHTAITNIEEAGRPLVEIVSRNQLHVDREGQRTTIEIDSRSTETPTGELLRFRTEMNAGSSRTVMTGEVRDGHMHLQTVTAGKTMSDQFPWPPGTLGFSATEQSLAASPLLPGQKRTLKALMPATNELVTIDLVADKLEPTTLLAHTEDLLRIDSTLTLPSRMPDDKPSILRSRLWTNAQGQVLKTAVAALHQETFRTTREQALGPAGPKRLDLVVDNTVPVARALANPHGTQRIKYRVRLVSDDPAKVFAVGRLQEVLSIDPKTAEIIVRRDVPPVHSADAAAGELAIVEPAPGTAAPASAAAAHKSRRPPNDDDRQPNNLIQSDDPRVILMANSVAGETTDSATIALALERFVKQTIKLKNFSQALSTAAEVAEMREGDCTEHAVLLAALARARGIPSRVAIGLVYQPGGQSFAYHMWNELWIDGRWLPLDATLGRGNIGAAHLKLTDSNLAGAQAYSCFLPVAQVIGQLKLEILEVE